jgi:hypothetical protein
MKEECPELFNDDISRQQFHDFELREGQYSRVECFGRFKQLVGPNREYSEAESAIPETVREKCRSVFKEPLLLIPGDFNSGEPMHKTQGFTTHLSEATLAQFHSIAGGGWAKKKRDEVLEIA